MPAAATATPKQCCRVCRKGKACGNGCISQERQCTKAQGCACNASRPASSSQPGGASYRARLLRHRSAAFLARGSPLSGSSGSSRMIWSIRPTGSRRLGPRQAPGVRCRRGRAGGRGQRRARRRCRGGLAARGAAGYGAAEEHQAQAGLSPDTRSSRLTPGHAGPRSSSRCIARWCRAFRWMTRTSSGLIQGLRLASPCTQRIDRLIDLLEQIRGAVSGPRRGPG
jgi:hypothetical protein